MYLQQNLDELTDTAVPENIRLNQAMDLELAYTIIVNIGYKYIIYRDGGMPKTFGGANCN